MAGHSSHHDHGHGTKVFADGPLEHHETHGTIFQRIILPFIWLLLITAAEFFIALVIKNEDNKTAVDITFVVMTLVKAFFIVSYFMHLKFEFKGLKWSIVFPLLFIVYLLVLMVLEGTYMYNTLVG
ncbi:MAG: cytochrome C oxidase subunit IV family protein [Bacteroidetes bacterium]|nr:cytochrome C oxidase subunit IV family protein [Bacteroidota bacterium]